LVAAGTFSPISSVAERGDDGVDRLGIDQVVGQMVVDLGVGQEAALLAELDQNLELVAAGLDVFRRTGGHALQGFLQRLFARAAVLVALLGAHLLRNLYGGIDGVVAGLGHGVAGDLIFFSRLGLATGLALGCRRDRRRRLGERGDFGCALGRCRSGLGRSLRGARRRSRDQLLGRHVGLGGLVRRRGCFGRRGSWLFGRSGGLFGWCSFLGRHRLVIR
jgi:hypothetical protein